MSNAADGHLDADELCAYAENVLPAPARARYTMHLAECSRCRELVVQLSSSVGVVAATDTTRVSGPSILKKFLASLFTPMVLRYAAPALGLIVVAVIGFVVLRRNQSNQYVTQVTNTEQRPALQPAAEQPAAGFQGPTAAKSSPEALVDKQAKNQTAQPAPPPNAPPAVSNIQAEVSKDAATAQAKPEQQPASANEPPPPKPAPSATPEERQKTVDTEVNKKEVRGVAAAAPTAEGGLRAERENRKDDFARVPTEPSDKVSTPAVGGVSKLKRGGVDVSANTRTVAGRRFRKQGGIWIDTAYDSSKDSVTLARGSEQYRALVADEPEIKKIADELDGEIIVVWKGRAYHIR